MGCLPLSASLRTIPLDTRSQWTVPVHIAPSRGPAELLNTACAEATKRGLHVSSSYLPQPFHAGIACRCDPRRD